MEQSPLSLRRLARARVANKTGLRTRCLFCEGSALSCPAHLTGPAPNKKPLRSCD